MGFSKRTGIVVRHLLKEELPLILEYGAEVYEEVYGGHGETFNPEFFQQYWEKLYDANVAQIWVAQEPNGEFQAYFGGVHGENIFTGAYEFIGVFTVVKDKYRGTGVLYTLYDKVFQDLNQRVGRTTFTTRIPALKHVLQKYGFNVYGETLRKELG